MARYQKVLVLLDLSEDSAQVLSAGRELAAHSNAAIVVLHVVDYTPMEPLGESMMMSMPVERELADVSRKRLDRLIAGGEAVNVTARIEIGNTKTQILRVAEEEHADLIVLGSRERHGLAILVNFTEDTVLHAAHCDVLAVRLH
jgi:universal stress protein A